MKSGPQQVDSDSDGILSMGARDPDMQQPECALQADRPWCPARGHQGTSQHVHGTALCRNSRPAQSSVTCTCQMLMSHVSSLCLVLPDGDSINTNEHGKIVKVPYLSSVLPATHLLKAEHITVVDIVGGVLRMLVLGQPDLDVRQKVGIRAVIQHPVALRRPGVPDT